MAGDKLRLLARKVDQYGIDYFGAEVYAAMGLKPSSILYIARA